MSPDQTIRILQRLLLASSDSSRAYRCAAGAVTSPGFETLFDEYGKDHARIASWVTRQIARVCREQHVETPPPLTQQPNSHDLSFLLTTDPYALLAVCINLQDVLIDELGKAKESSLAAPLHRFIVGEYEQVRWAREGLDRLRRERKTPSRPRASVNVMEQLRLLEAQSFEPERFVGHQSVAR